MSLTDAIHIVGGIIAMPAAILGAILSYRQLRSLRASGERQGVERSKQRADGPIARLFPQLFRREVAPVVITGVSMNGVGILLSDSVPSVLFLDMSGTALVAMLLGPWWACFVAIMANGYVNVLLYSGSADFVLPWIMSNMAGAIFWGYSARSEAFREYLAAEDRSWLHDLAFLAWFGLVGSAVISVPGVITQLAIGRLDLAMPSSELALSIWRYLGELEFPLFATQWVGLVFWSIPDKVLSSALALLFLRFLFPLLERHLIHGQPGRRRQHEGVVPLVACLLVYSIPLVVFWRDESYRFPEYWWFWLAPIVVLVAQLLHDVFVVDYPTDLSEQRRRRKLVYEKASKIDSVVSSDLFFTRLRLAVIAAVICFLLGLWLLDASFYRTAFNFLLVSMAGLGSVHLWRSAAAQYLVLQQIPENASRIASSAVVGEQMEEPSKGARLLIEESSLSRQIYRQKTEDGEEVQLLKFGDAVSAYGRLLPGRGIPGKSVVAASICKFWYKKLSFAEPSAFLDSSSMELSDEVRDKSIALLVTANSPVAIVVRRFLVGSLWQRYRDKDAMVLELLGNDKKLDHGARFANPVLEFVRAESAYTLKRFLPATEAQEIVGEVVLSRLRDWSRNLFAEAEHVCAQVGLTLGDTTFRYGRTERERSGGSTDFVLTDELLTPDVSRYWPNDTLITPEHALDRQVLEWVLSNSGWSRADPIPALPDSVMNACGERYRRVGKLLGAIS